MSTVSFRDGRSEGVRAGLGDLSIASIVTWYTVTAESLDLERLLTTSVTPWDGRSEGVRAGLGDLSIVSIVTWYNGNNLNLLYPVFFMLHILW